MQYHRVQVPLVIKTASVAGLSVWLSAARGMAGALVFSYASVTDVRTRRVDNRVWLVAGAVGALLLVAEAVAVGFPQPVLLLSIPVVVALAWLLYQARLLFGGADAKALMALAVLIPFHTALEPLLPLAPSFLTRFAFPFAVFADALLVTILIPPALFVYNMVRGDRELPIAFVGYRIAVEDLATSWAWPMERPAADGAIERSYFPSRKEADVTAGELREAGVERVWVTPKVPFMIPLALGFGMAFVAGDVLSALVRGVMGL